MGNPFNLSDMRGKKVWLDFCTSPGGRNCTAHACGYRDNLAQFTAKGIEIVGVNNRPASEQKEWVEQARLPFRVLSDPDRSIARDYGIWVVGADRYVANNADGRRPAVLVDEQGKIARIPTGPDDRQRRPRRPPVRLTRHPPPLPWQL